MADLRGQIAKVAAVGTTVCLYGESGTGKELVARAIHYTGPRAGYPLVVLDCPAVPAGLMESELFGHVKGAFTSATGDRPGVFQLAEGGTLVLDEIGELPLSLQATLLRVLQGREVRPVGGRHPIPVNVRLIAATNRDLRTLVRAGQFREDLFFRLEGIPITLPPCARAQGTSPSWWTTSSRSSTGPARSRSGACAPASWSGSAAMPGRGMSGSWKTP